MLLHCSTLSAFAVYPRGPARKLLRHGASSLCHHQSSRQFYRAVRSIKFSLEVEVSEMNAVFMDAVESIEVRKAPVPSPGPGEALLKVQS